MSQLIDRNLRQKLMPFVVQPENYENIKEDETSTAPIQKWSFRDMDDESNVKIGIMPEDHDNFKNDISFKLLYGFDKNKINADKDLNIQDVLNNIPGIQIREYTQDTRLDAILSLVDYFKRGSQDGSEIAKKFEGKIENVQAFQDLITYDLKNIQQCKGWEDILKNVEDYITNSGADASIVLKDSNYRKMTVDFVYMMYYRLLTTTTSNIYIIPNSSNWVFGGNGEQGFEQSEGFTFKGDDKSIGGKLLTFIAPSINIQTTPIWRGIKGGSGVNIDITLNLFNDQIEKAIRNMLFVYTLLPQNLPTQYAIFAQPPSLYDIKIEGGNRLFMCSGNFECKYKGVLRTPNETIKQKLMKHINPNFIESFGDSAISQMLEHNMIKIPDVYEITMHFKSLLPNTFNNFLFQYSLNSNMHTQIQTNKGFIDYAPISNSIKTWLTNRADNAVELAKKYEDIDENKRKLKEALDSSNYEDVRKYQDFVYDKTTIFESVAKK